MNDAKKAKRADREPSRLLLSLAGRLERYMARAGLIAFVADPAGGAGGDAPAGDKPAGDAPAGDAPGGDKPAGDKPAGDALAGDKPAGGKPAGDAPAGDKPAGDKPVGAPEKYEFKLPDGMTPDTPVMGEFQTLAKELNLPQDKAQQVVDLAGKLQQQHSQQIQSEVEAFYADIGGMPDKWAEALAADKELGGDKLDANRAIAKRALEQFGTPELNAFLVKTKAGDHPEVIRAFYRAGLAISEDGFVQGRGAAPGRNAQSLYSASKMNP